MKNSTPLHIDLLFALGCMVLLATTSDAESVDAFIEDADVLIEELDELGEIDQFLVEAAESSVFDLTVTAGFSGGYTNNVILERNPLGSYFTRSSLDLFGTYLPAESPWVVSFFEYVEARVFEEENFEDEYLIMSQATASREIDSWTLGLEFGHIYTRQVVDESDSIYSESGLFTLSEPHFKVSVGSDLSERLWVETSLSLARELYDDEANDNWRGSFEVRGGYDFESGTRLELYLSYERERYDTKEPRTKNGLGGYSGERLELSRLRLGAEYHRPFSTNWEWRTRVWIERESEPVGAYYDRWEGDFRQSLSWSSGPWKLKLEGRVYSGKYDERETYIPLNKALGTLSRYERVWQFKWAWQVSCARTFGDHLKVELQVDEQELESNRIQSEYRAIQYELKVAYSF